MIYSYLKDLVGRNINYHLKYFLLIIVVVHNKQPYLLEWGISLSKFGGVSVTSINVSSLFVVSIKLDCAVDISDTSNSSFFCWFPMSV